MSSAAIHNNSVLPASDFGDVQTEFAALLSGAGIFDLRSRAKIALTGKDRVRWLNGMVTNSIRDLAAGSGVYAFLLNQQGHILADLDAYNLGDSIVVETDQSQMEKMLATFRRYIIMDKVEIANIDDKWTTIGVAGPKAREVLHAAGIQFAELEPLRFIEVTWQNTAVMVVRSDNPSVEGYEVWAPPDQFPLLWDALVPAVAKPVGTAAVELLRIACGVPRYGQDIRERDLPQETEQQRALNFTKGCYIGQEIVERIRSRGAVHRKFTGFQVQGSLPATGVMIQVEGRDIGEITSAAALPTVGGERRVALGYLRREFAIPGRQFQAGDTRVAIADLPFAEIFPRHNQS